MHRYTQVYAECLLKLQYKKVHYSHFACGICIHLCLILCLIISLLEEELTLWDSLPSTELVEALQLSHRSYLPIKLMSMPGVLPLAVSLLVPLLLLEEYLSFSPTFIFISFPYESIHLRGIASWYIRCTFLDNRVCLIKRPIQTYPRAYSQHR